MKSKYSLRKSVIPDKTGPMLYANDAYVGGVACDKVTISTFNRSKDTGWKKLLKIMNNRSIVLKNVEHTLE